jgi:hypothetical protein
MAQITATHLAPLLHAFIQALREERITIQQAEDFSNDTYTAVLEQRVIVGERARKNRGGAKEPEGGAVSAEREAVV